MDITIDDVVRLAERAAKRMNRIAQSRIKMNRHPQLQAFIDQMIADPAEDTTRLALADWLEENGMEQQAARMRWWVQAKQVVTKQKGNPRNYIRPAVRRIEPEWFLKLIASHEVQKHHDRLGRGETSKPVTVPYELAAIGIPGVEQMLGRFEDHDNETNRAALGSHPDYHSHMSLGSLKPYGEFTFPDEAIDHAIHMTSRDYPNPSPAIDHTRQFQQFAATNPPPE